MGSAKHQVIVSRRGVRGWLILLGCFAGTFFMGGISFADLILGEPLFPVDSFAFWYFILLAAVSFYLTTIFATLNMQVSAATLHVSSIWGSRTIEWNHVREIAAPSYLFGEVYLWLEFSNGSRRLVLYTNVFSNHEDLVFAIADAASLAKEKPLVSSWFVYIYGLGPYGFFGTQGSSKHRE